MFDNIFPSRQIAADVSSQLDSIARIVVGVFIDRSKITKADYLSSSSCHAS
jgi:hypothetical protein